MGQAQDVRHSCALALAQSAYQPLPRVAVLHHHHCQQAAEVGREDGRQGWVAHSGELSHHTHNSYVACTAIHRIWHSAGFGFSWVAHSVWPEHDTHSSLVAWICLSNLEERSKAWPPNPGCLQHWIF